jgi:hypothetical protein
VNGPGTAGPVRRRNKPRVLPEPWTGITGPDCHLCSWSWRNGRREVKVRSEACHVHRGTPAQAGRHED